MDSIDSSILISWMGVVTTLLASFNRKLAADHVALNVTLMRVFGNVVEGTKTDKGLRAMNKLYPCSPYDTEPRIILSFSNEKFYDPSEIPELVEKFYSIYHAKFQIKDDVTVLYALLNEAKTHSFIFILNKKFPLSLIMDAHQLRESQDYSCYAVRIVLKNFTHLVMITNREKNDESSNKELEFVESLIRDSKKQQQKFIFCILSDSDFGAVGRKYDLTCTKSTRLGSPGMNWIISSVPASGISRNENYINSKFLI